VTVRISKTDTIAGLPAELARTIVRQFKGGYLIPEAIADLLEGTGLEPGPVFAGLEKAGFLKGKLVRHGEEVWWETTIQGNALAMASLGKPIKRTTADRLVAGLLDRARDYNADPGKPMFINTLTVFGSYLRPEVDPVGDIDIELTYGSRITNQKVLSAYTKASGRSFGTYLDELLWPQAELLLYLKNKSAFINITTEDVSKITSQFETIYSINDDPQAVPAPVDAVLIGR